MDNSQPAEIFVIPSHCELVEWIKPLCPSSPPPPFSDEEQRLKGNCRTPQQNDNDETDSHPSMPSLSPAIARSSPLKTSIPPPSTRNSHSTSGCKRKLETQLEQSAGTTLKSIPPSKLPSPLPSSIVLDSAVSSSKSQPDELRDGHRRKKHKSKAPSQRSKQQFWSSFDELNELIDNRHQDSQMDTSQSPPSDSFPVSFHSATDGQEIPAQSAATQPHNSESKSSALSRVHYSNPRPEMNRARTSESHHQHSTEALREMPPPTSRSAPSSPSKPKHSASSSVISTVGPSSAGKLLDGYRFVFLPSSELTPKRIEIMKKEAFRLGGSILSTTGLDCTRSLARATHVIYGGEGVRARNDPTLKGVYESLASMMKSSRLNQLRFMAAEWLVEVFKKNRIPLISDDRWEWKRFDVSPSPMPPLLLPNNATYIPPPPAAASSTANFVGEGVPFYPFPSNIPVPPKKRDIKYVLESMQMEQQQRLLLQQQQEQQTTAATSFQPQHNSPVRTASSATSSALSSHSPAVELESSASSVAVKNEVVGATDLDEKGVLTRTALNRAKREQKEMRAQRWQRSPAKNNSPADRNASSASLSSLPPLTQALTQSYTQAVPSFADVVPYDAKMYQPLPEQSQYLSQQYPQSQVPDEVQATTVPHVPAVTSSSSNSGTTAALVKTMSSSSSLNDESPPPPVLSTRKQNWVDRSRAHLACQIFSSQHRNLNAHLTGPLEKLEEMNGSIGDKWRTYAYRKAVGILKKYPTKITTQDEIMSLAAIRGLGAKMLQKLSEILATGKLQKVVDMSANNQIATVALFSKIHGVGATTALRWYSMGHRSVADVLNDPHVKLNDTQKVGIQYMHDKAKRIPRLEVNAILEYVQRIANRILPGVTVICCGSFRRGAPSSGDVDLLFTHPTFTHSNLPNEQDDPVSVQQREGFLKQLLKVLGEEVEPGSQRYEEESAWACQKYTTVKEEWDRANAAKAEKERQEKMETNGSSYSSSDSFDPNVTEAAAASATFSTPNARTNPLLRLLEKPKQSSRFLSASLSHFEKLSSQHGQAYWMGFCCLPRFHPFHSGVHRRLDIKVYPVSHFPFALLYFTGSDHFNRSMRFFAKQKQWTLSDHGLAPAVRIHGDKIWSGKSVYCATEKDVFDSLGLMYVPPEQRNVYNHFDVSEEELRMMRSTGNLNAVNSSASFAPSVAGADEDDLMEDEALMTEDNNSLLVPMKQEPAAANSSSSSSASSVHYTPLSVVKREVKLELEEMDLVRRATLGLQRLQQEEEENFRNQFLALQQKSV